jgi:uncharacterized protein (DUF1501 family)
MTPPLPTRRVLLKSAAGLGLSAAWLAAPAVVSAAVGGPQKIIVVTCRGGMDGLSVAPPVGDSEYAGLRGALAIEDGGLPIDGTFALHPRLRALHAMALAGQARIAPAVASLDRSRAHFEAGLALDAKEIASSPTDWLDRTLDILLARQSGARQIIGAARPQILRAKGLEANFPAGDGTLLRPQGQEAARVLGGYVAAAMRSPGGPVLTSISLGGFDSHTNQLAVLDKRLAYLDALLGSVRDGLGPAWQDTVMLVTTEFGRAARPNHTGGADHGTASAALLVGGALKRGGIVGDWPTLKPKALFENRDVAPTLDVRGIFKGVLQDHLGIERQTLDDLIFPASAAAQPIPGLT